MFAVPRWLAGLCILLLLGTGCGSGEGSLSGVVNYEGTPVVSGNVTVFGPDSIPRAGKIQPDGRYEVTNIGTGPVRIAVESPDPQEQSAPTDSDGGGAPPTRPPGWRALPARYGDINTSDLKFDLKAGSNTLNILLQ